MIIQGTTPTHSFTLPFDSADIRTARFVYSQRGELKLVKDMEDITMEGYEVSTTLTQEDTFEFDPNTKVELVLRVLTIAGEALALARPVNLLCREIADKEVLA